MMLEHQLKLQMGWGLSWRAALRAEVVVVAFSVSSIFEDGNKKDGTSLQVILTQLEVSGEFILGYFIFSRLVALTMIPARNLVGTRVLPHLKKATG